MSLQEEVTTENDISEVPVVSSNNNSTLYDRKRQSKAIRVLTVLAYILSVSLAAIFLSIYYIFVWDGQSTLAAKSFAEPQTAVGGTQETFQEALTTNVVVFKNTTESFKRLYTKRDTFENYSVKRFADVTLTAEISGKRQQNSSRSNETTTDGPLNNTFGLSTSEATNNSLDLEILTGDELQLGLPEPTEEAEDSTLFSTSTEDYTTWLPEINDYNSEFSDDFNKRSVFMQKLFRHQNVIRN